MNSLLKKRGLTAGALTAIIIAAVFAMTTGSKGSGSANDAPTLSVSTTAIRIDASYQALATYPGRIRAGRRSQLGFERGGRLAEVAADDGDTVSKGTVIAKLDQRQLKAQHTAAKAQVDAATAALAEVKAAHKLAANTQERQRALLEKGHISQQGFDNSTYAIRAAEARVSTAQARLAEARAQVEAIAVSLALSDLVAPYDGTIVRRMADEGTILGPGTPIFDFEENGPIEFVSGVPIAATKGLAPGTKAIITITDVPYRAALSRVVKAVDTNTRTAQLVFTIDGDTRPATGEVGELALPRDESAQGFWVPVEALQEGARGLWTVFVAVPAGKGAATIERHPVELLYSELKQAFVRGTPDDGDLVVTSGTGRLVPGQRVLLAGQS